MRKYALPAIAGALAMFIALMILANIRAAREQTHAEYIAADYVSKITTDECFVCSDNRRFSAYTYWGQDNVGVVSLNTFNLLPIEIKRYDDYSNLIEETAGYVTIGGMHDDAGEVLAYAYMFPDDNYAKVYITDVKYEIDRDSLQGNLCQSCLDVINDISHFSKPLAEYAVISFEERTIRPLMASCSWFAVGNFSVDCEFDNAREMNMLIHYIKA